MNRLVFGALAGAIFASPSYASENEWLSLDQEIEALSSSLSQAGGGPQWFGWFRASWRDTSDLGVAAPSPPVAAGTNDLQGFQTDSVRLGVTGEVGDYGYKVEADFGGSGIGGPPTPAAFGSFGLLDAYAFTTVGEQLTVQLGNFRQPFVRSASISRDRLLFLDRSGIGESFAGRSLGLQLSGSFETVDWFLAAQNGISGQGDDYVFSGRAEVDLLGGGVSDYEGAWGSSDETTLTAGLAIADEGVLADGLHYAVDAAMTAGPFAASGEVVDYDTGDDGTGPDLFGKMSPTLGFLGVGGGTDVQDTTPWNVAASYMFTDMYEAGIRYEDDDDSNDTTAISLVVNRYVQGHDIKWQVQYTAVDSDVTGANPSGDIDWFGFGLTLSF